MEGTQNSVTNNTFCSFLVHPTNLKVAARVNMEGVHQSQHN